MRRTVRRLYKKFCCNSVIHTSGSLAHFFPLTISLNVELALKDG